MSLALHRLVIAVMLVAVCGTSSGQNSDDTEVVATGSGFMVSARYLVTNAHVVEGCGTVTLDGGGPLSIVKIDKSADLALLAFEKDRRSLPLNLRQGRGIRLGDDVVVAGFPLSGLLAPSLNVTTGTVSSLAGLMGDRTRIQITAPVQPGNSGGPLLDSSGNVVGVVVSKLNALGVAGVNGDIPQNVNFAVSLGTLQAFLDANSVAYQTRSSTTSMRNADVADVARAATMLIECRMLVSITPPAPLARSEPFSSRPAPSAPSVASAPSEGFRDCSSCPEMMSIPAGSFMMGSPASETDRGSDEGPQRRVTVQAFAVGRYEVTWTEYGACVSTGGCKAAADDGFGRGSRPVTNVSWEDAQVYVKWLSSQTGQAYRLLSEAEWEYAARAKSGIAYPWGSSARHAYANYGDLCCVGFVSDSDRWVNTSPVGSFPPNSFRLYDMHGNVWEWVGDCYANSYSAGQPSNGGAYSPKSCSNRVLRGGSWDSRQQLLRSAVRSKYRPSYRSNNLGFRVARTL